MAGGVVDLSDPLAELPRRVVVDTNIVFERLARDFGFQSHPVNEARARDFFNRLILGKAVGFVTPAVYSELVHLIVKARYRAALTSDRAALVNRYGPLGSWADLYKRDPTILRAMRPVLLRLDRLLRLNRMYLVSEDKLGSVPSGNPIAQELIEVMCRYGLDSTDAMILIEAGRIPVLEIATLDADLLRAQADYTIYTWT